MVCRFEGVLSVVFISGGREVVEVVVVVMMGIGISTVVVGRDESVFLLDSEGDDSEEVISGPRSKR